MSTDDPSELAMHIVTLAAGRRMLIAVDHDGTLSAIAPRPDAATLAPGAEQALRRLCDVADVAIVSGRGLEDLERRFAGLPVDLVSEHGLRHRRRDGVVEQLTAGLAASTLAALRPQLAALLADRAGWIVEDKGVGLAVHHRLVPAEELEPTLGAVRALLDAAADERSAAAPSAPAGHLQVGKAVLELRPAGADKGAAVRQLAATHRGADGLGPLVLMVGDDATDEPALEAAEQLGGVGVLVADAPRETSASARVTGPDAVVQLLDALADALAQPIAGGPAADGSA